MHRLGLADFSIDVWPIRVQHEIRALRLTVDEHRMVAKIEGGIRTVIQVRHADRNARLTTVDAMIEQNMLGAGGGIQGRPSSWKGCINLVADGASKWQLVRL